MTGRIKEIIITGFFLLTPFIILAAMTYTAGGENIAPVPIEDALKADPVLQVHYWQNSGTSVISKLSSL